MANVTFFSPDGGTTRYPIEDTEARNRIDNLVTGVSSFNGRSGSILPVAGDYDATQVTYSTGVTTKEKIDSVEGTKTTPVSCLVGDTDVTITNSAIHTTSTIDIYYETASGNPITYTSAVVTEGQIVITFASALEEAASIKLRITN